MPRYRPIPAAVRVNLTPLIDVVFLLIIFFMLVCQFIARDNLQLVVPDDCTAAQPQEEQEKPLTLAIYSARPGELTYLLHGGRSKEPPRQWTGPTPPKANELAAAIAARAGDATTTITLRADQNLDYQSIQPALTAFAQANITEIRLASRKAANRDVNDDE